MDMMLARQRISKLVSELDALRLSHVRPLENVGMAPCPCKTTEKPEYLEAFKNGSAWGGSDLHFWFQVKVSIPPEYEGRTVVLVVKTGRQGWNVDNPQFLAFINDCIVQGLDVNHRELFITEAAKTGDEFDISFYAYSGRESRQAFFEAETAVLEREIEGLYYDIKAPLDAVGILNEHDKRSVDILRYLENTVALIDFRKAHCYHDSFLDSVCKAREYIQTNLYQGYCGHEDYYVHGIGSTHIDVAWLWTLSQTREKAIRSFSTVLELMRHYPEYRFTMSQPQLYQFVKENSPEIYEEIVRRAKEGRWEPEGAMWLEADCNLTSGESLVRQILFGKRFFKEEFGVESRVLWLPDVFGYSAALPQILKKSGIDYFITSKISWNEYNKAPYDTFTWEGIDGSTVLTHFLTTTDPGQDYEKHHNTTYNGQVLAETVAGTWGRYQQKNLSNRVLMSYGYGDGGGGPTREMLEYGRRLTAGIPGLPRFRFDSLKNFLYELSGQIEQNKNKLPRWVGELYLEYHRGTYTSMARNKKYNRKAELSLMEAEGLYTMVHTLLNEAYPTEDLNRIWQTVLLNQFHDIIPGSSIRQVYEESKAQYEKIFEALEGLKESAYQRIAQSVFLKDQSLLVFNPTGFAQGNLVETQEPLPEWCKNVRAQDGKLLPVQRTHDGKTLLYIPYVPPKGYAVYTLTDEEITPKESITVNAHMLENSYYRITLDEHGLISSIYDKRYQREVIKKGEKANKLTAFEDIPHNYDAWDINIYYQQKHWDITELQSITVLEQGPVRGTIELKRCFLDSTIIQYIHIYNECPRIDFRTHIDWKERHILLKTAFPVDIHHDKAVYDIQFGNVERPTHWNTSWDMARFEVCGHKWADLSESGYGVSLLNDCKYGYDIKGGTMRLTLIKSATSPNEDADREEHDFIYSLLPHGGDFRVSAIPQAYALNMPFKAILEAPHEGKLPGSFSMCSLSENASGACPEHIVIETLKKAEQGDEMILRIYEAHNKRGPAAIKFPLPIKAAYECTLLEENTVPLDYQDCEVYLHMLPYEIKTIKIEF